MSMKKYMVIIRDSETGDQTACFTDSWVKADNMRMDAEVCAGDFAQVYEWMEDPEDPDLGYSYREI